MNYNYFFVLGSNPALSIMELMAVLKFSPADFIVLENVLLLNSKTTINTQALMKQLGGTIKIGLILKSLPRYDDIEIFKTFKNEIHPETISGKFTFGFSVHGKKRDIHGLAMEIKKELRSQEISCRWVISKEPILSSVVVEQNNLTSRGIEFNIISDKETIFLGKTLTVQPFKELSFIDFGRPGRDDASGMLPPKLARIMLNLGQINAQQTILDPFCGSGTIVTECLLQDCQDIIGSDISPRAIADSQKNIDWVKKKFKPDFSGHINLFQSDSLDLLKKLPPHSVDAIVTEPWLGPQRHKIAPNQLRDLEKLYSDSIRVFSTLLKSGGRIVMIWPIFHINNKLQFINVNLADFKLQSNLTSQLSAPYQKQLSPRGNIIYGRSNQNVWREIVVLEK